MPRTNHRPETGWISTQIEVLKRRIYGFSDEECFFLNILNAWGDLRPILDSLIHPRNRNEVQEKGRIAPALSCFLCFNEMLYGELPTQGAKPRQCKRHKCQCRAAVRNGSGGVKRDHIETRRAAYRATLNDPSLLVGSVIVMWPL